MFISLSILILVHELGHFYSARILKVKVEEFGFGFPPRIFSRIRNGIRYSINLLPFGGFVKIFGEHGEGERSPDSFMSRPAWQRFVILVAGVCMNVALAWILFSASAAIGTPRLEDTPQARSPVSVLAVVPESPAQRAGLRLGDQIIELRASDISLRVEKEDDVRDFMAAYRGEEITIIIKRGNLIHEVKATPRAQPPAGEGPLGIAMGNLTMERVPWYMAKVEGARITGYSLVAIVTGLAEIIRDILWGTAGHIDVSGPIGIFTAGRDFQTLGISYLLRFIGILSINLAVLNVLPIPALDGGRIFFLLIEKIKGSKINPRVENTAHAFGFAFLILLMVLVTYKDVVKLL